MHSDNAFSPFGYIYALSGAGDYLFTGEYQLTASNLFDFPAREYNNEGRWISPDPGGLAAANPANPQSWNRYAYILGNPLALIDPLGLDVGECDPYTGICTPCGFMICILPVPGGEGGGGGGGGGSRNPGATPIPGPPVDVGSPIDEYAGPCGMEL